jgi:hypothetical protein
MFRIALHNHASSKQKAHRIMEMRVCATEEKAWPNTENRCCLKLATFTLIIV